VKLCPLHWNVTLRDTKQKIDGLDRDLFDTGEQTAPARRPS
jgi:hypothetical protein